MLVYARNREYKINTELSWKPILTDFLSLYTFIGPSPPRKSLLQVHHVCVVVQVVYCTKVLGVPGA